MIAKAATRGADALILDMEDAVAPAAKLDARATIAAHLDEFGAGGPEVWIRVNNLPDLCEGDLAVAAHPVVQGVFLPKIQTAGEVERAAAILDKAGRAGVPLDAMIETGRAVLEAEAIATAPNVVHLTLGLADLSADLHVNGAPDDPVWAPIRLQVVIVSAATGLDPPIAPVSPNFTDLGAFAAGCSTWADAGYGGRQAIHPAQVQTINSAFNPSDEELAEARRLLALFDAALADGRGAIRDRDSNMLDEAFVRRARRIVALADDS